MSEEQKENKPMGSSTDVLKDMLDISRDLQRINSYLINGQCILAYRHAVALRPSLGSTNNEPKQILEGMIRFIYDGRQVQAEAELKKLADIVKSAYEDIIKNLKKETPAV